MAEADGVIKIEVVHAEGERSLVKSMSLPPGSKVADALEDARQDPRFNFVDVAQATVGIYGVVASADQVLNDGDRIEIYRPLAEDPKAARRKRAKSLKKR